MDSRLLERSSNFKTKIVAVPRNGRKEAQGAAAISDAHATNLLQFTRFYQRINIRNSKEIINRYRGMLTMLTVRRKPPAE